MTTAHARVQGIIVFVAQVAERSKAPTTGYIPYSIIFMTNFLGNTCIAQEASYEKLKSPGYTPVILP